MRHVQGLKELHTEAVEAISELEAAQAKICAALAEVTQSRSNDIIVIT
eukprot:COSAG01_NODE_9037_length_2574_cov_2.353939_2_plen_48_part_00